MPGFDDDREEQHDREDDPAERGIGDSDGMAEQMALFMGSGYVG
jgi:hypothetical protein